MVRPTLFLSLFTATSVVFASQNSNRVSKTIIPGAYIFEFDENHDPTSFFNQVGQEGTTRIKFDFKLFKGVSIQLKDLSNHEQKAAQMAALPVVKNMWPVTLIPAPNPRVEWVADTRTGHMPTLNSRDVDSKKADNFPPHKMTQVDKLRAKGYTGKGIKVAVIDTGIDYKHPALGGCFGANCLVSFGTDLVGDAYDGTNTPQPDNDPMDCAGHGSHVSGIIAAQENPYGFTGAAPGVTLGAYRVFGCKGSAGNDVLISAYNKAFEDGAQIITASIGGPSGWSEDPWAVTVSRIVDAGVPCTVSAGNDGDQGLFYASGAADGKKVTAVASVDNLNTPTVFSISSFKVNNGRDQQFGYVPGEPENFQGVNLPLWAVSTDSTVKDDACSPLPANTPDLGNKIVLIRRGTCTFVQKAQNVAAKGAKNILFYNNAAAGAIPVDVTTVTQIISSGMVDNSTGSGWVQSLAAKQNVTLSMVGSAKAVKKVQYVDNNVTGGALSTFTTWGPTWEMDLKPQVSAPGGNILSTYPLALGGYAVLSGTSMACPITAGVVALIAQVRNSFDPVLIEGLLSATGHPQLFNDGSKFFDFLAPVAQQGGGLIQAFDAAFASTILSPSSLAFNDTDHFVAKKKFTINNTSKKSIKYTINHVPTNTFYTLTAGSIFAAPFPNEAVASRASLEFSKRDVTIPAGQATEIGVTSIPPIGVDSKRLALWSGYVAVNGSDGSGFSIPYQGLSGSLYKQIVLSSNDTWISKSDDTTNAAVSDKTVFTIPAPGNAKPTDELPSLVVNLALGSRLVRADIVSMSPPTNGVKLQTKDFFGTKSIGQPAGFPAPYSTRGALPVPWNGQLNDGNYAPPGAYKFVVRALRIFGNEKKKEDWDVSETTTFTIKYE